MSEASLIGLAYESAIVPVPENVPPDLQEFAATLSKRIEPEKEKYKSHLELLRTLESCESWVPTDRTGMEGALGRLETIRKKLSDPLHPSQLSLGQAFLSQELSRREAVRRATQIATTSLPAGTTIAVGPAMRLEIRTPRDANATEFILVVHSIGILVGSESVATVSGPRKDPAGWKCETTCERTIDMQSDLAYMVWPELPRADRLEVTIIALDRNSLPLGAVRLGHSLR